MLELCADALWWVDIYLRMHKLAFRDGARLETDPTRLRRRYVESGERRWDVAASLPWDLLALAGLAPGARSLALWSVLRFVRLLHLRRFGDTYLVVARWLTHADEKSRKGARVSFAFLLRPSQLVRGVRQMLVTFFLVHLAGCAWWLLGTFEPVNMRTDGVPVASWIEDNIRNVSIGLSPSTHACSMLRAAWMCE